MGQGKETIKKVSEKRGQARKAEERDGHGPYVAGLPDPKAAVTKANVFIILFLINFSLNASSGEYAFRTEQ